MNNEKSRRKLRIKNKKSLFSILKLGLSRDRFPVPRDANGNPQELITSVKMLRFHSSS
jgi:hypothetical protein